LLTKIDHIGQVEVQELPLDIIARQEVVKRIVVQPLASVPLVRLLLDIAEREVAHQEHLPIKVLEVEPIADPIELGQEARQAEAAGAIVPQEAPLEVQAAIEVQAVLPVHIQEEDHLLEVEDHPLEAEDHQVGAQAEVGGDNRPQKFH